ncbi:hypothetical protein [Schlesneria sp. T3-172]|uniref:hypothetical protein n=1 Tax=Schlesneria sphaerica TaxID=3373610 RepID=UPI0037C95265
MASPDALPGDDAVSQESRFTPDQVGAAMATLKAAGDSGASWFFWIAGLSLVNSAISHFGGEVHFIVGLAVTAIVDAIASEVGQAEPGLATAFKMIAIGISVVVAAASIGFGLLAMKRFLWIFAAGMFLYLLDGLIYLAFGDLLSAAFHGYALYCMLLGFNAYRQLNKLEAALASATETDDEADLRSDQEISFETP